MLTFISLVVFLEKIVIIRVTARVVEKNIHMKSF